MELTSQKRDKILSEIADRIKRGKAKPLGKRKNLRSGQAPYYRSIEKYHEFMQSKQPKMTDMERARLLCKIVRNSNEIRAEK